MRLLRRFAAACIATAMAVLVFAAVAPASYLTPPFDPFGDCQYENASVEYCVHSVSESGSLTVGKKTIPVVNPITLQGGYSVVGAALQFYAAADGNTLSKTPEPVPGGLLGVTAPTSWPLAVQEWFNNAINEGFTGVTATVELAEPASAIELNPENLIFEEPATALGLPVKIKLSNAILGSNCYIGSNTEPIQLGLRTGSSGGLTGTAGTISFNGNGTLITFSGIRFVNETFVAPEAEGCGGIYHAYVDPLIDSLYGLRSASGKNSATLEGVFEAAEAAEVLAHKMP
jgi:hypothetical protein